MTKILFMTRTHFLTLLLSTVALKRVKPISKTPAVSRELFLKVAREGIAAISLLFKKPKSKG